MERGVVFSLQEQRFALPLEVVVRVVHAVHVTPVTHAPPMVRGVIDVHGEVLPVVDVRERFGLPPHEIELSDRFVIARAGARTLALWVDRVHDVVSWSDADFVAARSLLPGSRHVRGIARGGDGLLLVHDLEGLVDLDDVGAPVQGMA